MRRRTMVDWYQRCALAFILCCAMSVALSADDLETLDADFLSYLAELEGEDDDWTIVEPVSPPKQPSSAQPAEPKSSSDDVKKRPPSKQPSDTETKP